MVDIICIPQNVYKAAVFHAHVIGEVSRAEGLRSTIYSPGKTQFDIDLTGALGEIAFSMYLGVPLQLRINSFKNPDVENYHVRSTQYPYGGLIVKKNDLEGAYVLMTQLHQDNDLEWVCRGWSEASEARQQRYQEGYNWWKVPQVNLHQFGDDEWL